jgi:hypothetical protein
MQPITQKTLTDALYVTKDYTGYLNNLLKVNANSFGMQYHKLIEKSFRAPSNITYSLNNIVPTPERVHTAISRLHSSRIGERGSGTLRALIQKNLREGKITIEGLYEAEARIWQLGMRLDGAPIPMKDALNILREYMRH